MDKDAILSFIKKNVFALTCGVVAIAAVVLAFYPFGGYLQGLLDDATKEANQYSGLSSLLHPRQLPQVDPAKTTPVELPSFPNEKQVEVGKAAVANLTKESDATVAYLVSLNGTDVHRPLVGGVLPMPINDTPKFTFADVYKRVLSIEPTESGLGPTLPPPVGANPTPPDPMPLDDRLAAQHALNLCNDVLRATQPPDKRLVDARTAWVQDNVFAPQIITANKVPVNQAEVQARFAVAAKQIPDDLAQEVSDKHKCYLDTGAFTPQASLLTATNHDLTEIWFAQLSLWMQTDVAEAVADLNAESSTVSGSVVKRVLRLDLPAVPMYRFAAAPAGSTGSAAPSTTDEKGKLEANYGISPTGRTSNAMYDVVPFRLLVDVDASRVNEVIAGLTKKRLIYIYNQDLYVVDPTVLAEQHYVYGSAPVVRLALVGEELFLRQWTKPMMPGPVQQLLGLKAGGPQPAAGVFQPSQQD